MSYSEDRSLLGMIQERPSEEIDINYSVEMSTGSPAQTYSNILHRSRASLLSSPYVDLVKIPRPNRAVLISLLPRYLQPGGLEHHGEPRATAYLDALRGFAAIAVVNHHFYWSNHILSLPFVNFVRQGRLMVDIFFVISGYVLTHRMIRLIRQQHYSDLLHCLASSTFRRYMRLFLSAGFGAFICMLMLYFNILGLHEAQRQPSFSAQMVDFIADMYHFTNPFANVTGYWYPGALNTRYHAFLWTIPVEFRGSMVVFLYCTATAEMTPIRRQTLCIIGIIASFMWAATYVSLFLFGALLAERSLAKTEAALVLPTTNTSSASSRLSGVMATHMLSGLCLLIGLFLCSQPGGRGASRSWPWSTLSKVVPSFWPRREAKEHFYLSISAALILYGLDSCKTWQRPFMFPFSQYIGALSFGIYIMQLPMKKLYVRVALERAVKGWLGDTTFTAFVNWVLFMFLLLWAADWFIRVDIKIIGLGKWAEKKMFIKEETKGEQTG